MLPYARDLLLRTFCSGPFAPDFLFETFRPFASHFLLRTFCFGSFASDLLLCTFCFAPFASHLLLETFCSGPFAWELLLGIFCSGPYARDLLLRTFCSESFASDLLKLLPKTLIPELTSYLWLLRKGCFALRPNRTKTMLGVQEFRTTYTSNWNPLRHFLVTMQHIFPDINFRIILRHCGCMEWILLSF